MGLPFLGDNAFLLDRLDEIAETPSCQWIGKIPDSGRADWELVPVTARLTVWIDRADMTRTVSHLFAPAKTASTTPSEEAWLCIPPDPKAP